MQKGLLGLTVFLAVLYVAGGLGFIVRYTSGSLDWEPSVLEAATFGTIPFAAAAMVLWGLRVSRQAPRLGPGLVAIAAVTMAVVWFWLFFVLLPVSIVVIAFAVSRARRMAAEGNHIALAR